MRRVTTSGKVEKKVRKLLGPIVLFIAFSRTWWAGVHIDLPKEESEFSCLTLLYSPF